MSALIFRVTARSEKLQQEHDQVSFSIVAAEAKIARVEAKLA